MISSKIDFITGNVSSFTVGVVPDYIESDFAHVGCIKEGENVIEIYLVKNGKLKQTTPIAIYDVYQLIPKRFRKPTYNFYFDRLDLISLSENHYTFFVMLRERTIDTHFVVQVNCFIDDIVFTKYFNKLYNTPKIYLGFNSSYIIKFIDNNEIRIPNFGILYIDTDNPSDISGKYIRIMKAALTDNEKEKLLPFISEEEKEYYEVYPIIDDYNDDPVVFRLPNNIEEHQFDFSTGMGVLKFKE